MKSMKNKNYIAILIALEYEIDKINYQHRKIKIDNQTYFVIDDKIILLFTGIGKTNSSYKTALLLSNFKNVKQIINIGSSGTVNKNINVFDINIANVCQYGDVDVSCDPKYKINQIPYELKYFETNKNTLKILNNIADSFNYQYVNGIAMTVDSFVTLDNLNIFKEALNENIYSLDMECAAIAQVCQHFNVPFNCVKIISDNPLIKNNHNNFSQNMKNISIMTANIINEIICYFLKIK